MRICYIASSVLSTSSHSAKQTTLGFRCYYAVSLWGKEGQKVELLSLIAGHWQSSYSSLLQADSIVHAGITSEHTLPLETILDKLCASYWAMASVLFWLISFWGCVSLVLFYHIKPMKWFIKKLNEFWFLLTETILIL